MALDHRLHHKSGKRYIGTKKEKKRERYWKNKAKDELKHTITV